MRLDRIELTNFRSFGPETETLRFPADGNFLALVGANNAGKSNLLTALRYVLGAAGNVSAVPADFHQLDLEQEIRIELHFREPLKIENVVHGVDEVHGFFVSIRQAKQGGEKGQIKTDHYGLDASGKP